MNDLYTALSGAVAQERKLDIISNNLANISTAGFRKQDITFAAVAPDLRFAELWDAQLDTAEEQGKPAPLITHRMTKQNQLKLNLTSGALVKTDHPLDVALHETKPELKGRAFFVVDTPQGEMLVRDGKFALDELDGTPRLVHQASGYPVLGGSSQAIDLPSTDVKIFADGRIRSNGSDIARLRVVTFNPGNDPVHRGSGMYTLKNDPADLVDLEEGGFKVQQGYVEQSNVNAVDELVRMIRVQRSYEAMVKFMQNSDELRSRMISAAMQ